jgi:hypothetical protein
MMMKGFYGYLWLWFSITTMHKLTKEPSGVTAHVYKKFVVGSLLPNWHLDVISPIQKPDPRSISKLCTLIICGKNLKKKNLILIMQSSFTHTKSGKRKIFQRMQRKRRLPYTLILMGSMNQVKLVASSRSALACSSSGALPHGCQSKSVMLL